MSPASPESGTVERWAWDFVLTTRLADKMDPAPPPEAWSASPVAWSITKPGRPPELDVVGKSTRSLRAVELQVPHKRARLLHTFWHHELQAAELMCWAILAFPDTPPEFRRGLLGICRDELRHMGMYRRAMHELGASPGDFPVRDWFWTRVPTCRTPLQFVALFGLGLEGSNLDHTARYAELFERVGDERGAAVQRTVCREEIAHVEFAAHWFREWTGGLDFERWREELVAPLTPALFRGRPLNRRDRERAGLTTDFVAALEAFDPDAARPAVPRRRIELIGTVFSRAGQLGDFAWMLEQPEFADALFVFNDNEAAFVAFEHDARSLAGCAPGGGNAAIRPFRCQVPPRAAGIPTGDRGGYAALTDEVRAVIDRAIAVIEGLLATGRYARVVYSAADATGALGTGIFEVADDVRRHIVERLRAVVGAP